MTAASIQHRLRRRDAGFSTIESMVAMLVFSVGVVSTVGLQASMTRAQSLAKYRGDATYLAAELNGLMWADVPNLAKYASTQCSTYSRCSEWSGKVARVLPSGTATVVVNAADGTVTIAVSWTTPQGTQTYRTSTAVAA